MSKKMKMSKLLCSKLDVGGLIDSPYATSSKDGEKIFDWINFCLILNMEVIVSFSNVEIVTTDFLNSAFGQLYGKFRKKKLRALVKTQGLDKEDLTLLKTVLDNAKLYFKKQKESKNEQ